MEVILAENDDSPFDEVTAYSVRAMRLLREQSEYSEPSTLTPWLVDHRHCSLHGAKRETVD